MFLELYFHPLSSFCQKVLIALYENATPFQPRSVDLANETSAAALRKLWPIGKFPVLRDGARNRTVPESGLIIEYLDRHYPGRTKFLPTDPDVAHEARLRDRFFDLYVNERARKIVSDRAERCPRRRAGKGAAANRARNSGPRHGDKDLGHGRGVRHGGLRRRSRLVLC